MSITIALEQPDTPDVVALILELDQVLEPLYPSESRHGFSVQKLLDEGVAFFVVRHNEQSAACGGVQLLPDADPPFAEVKRMYVRPNFRGLGMAKMILQHIEQYIQQQQINVLRLETGMYQKEAIQLYEQVGFQRIPPFGNYFVDPVSRCYEKVITDTRHAETCLVSE